jgi:epoxyqueuosine reductase
MLTSSIVKQRAHELGFDLCGVAPAETPPASASALQAWLARGYHGEMHYLARTAEKRVDVRQVLPSAQSVVVLGTIYNTPARSSIERSDRLAALISRYAWGDDYHDVLAARLRALVEWMREQAGEPFDAKFYVDTGPLLERAFAERAGLGWIGKNTCLINPDLGSWLFLCEVICSVPLAPDAPGLDRCGTCTLCLEACPTGAFVAPHTLDATRCLSYLTIELKERVPLELREAMDRHVYGCDICQEVCPWNADPVAAVSDDPAWRARPAFDGADLLTLWRMPDDELRRAIRGTPMTRARVKRLRRNLAIAIGNSGEPAALAVFDEPIDAPSMEDPLVREHVEWAREQLGGKTEMENKKYKHKT